MRISASWPGVAVTFACFSRQQGIAEGKIERGYSAPGIFFAAGGKGGQIFSARPREGLG